MWSWLKRLFCKKKPHVDEVEQQREEENRSNLPDEPIPTLPRQYSTEEGEEELWYPKRVRNSKVDKIQLSTRGYYTGGHPKGSVVHTTAGRSRDKAGGGPRNQVSHYEQGAASLRYADKQDKYCYFLIDRDGNVFQNFPLNRWGYHAGKSSWPGMSGRVDNDMVGIEVMAAGKLTKVDDDRYQAWFTNTGKGDEYFHKSKGEVISYNKKWGNIEAGHYHVMSAKQKEALIELNLWMDYNSEDFSIENVAGHDEVSPGRKSDPGGALGRSMRDFRALLNKKKREKSLDSNEEGT